MSLRPLRALQVLSILLWAVIVGIPHAYAGIECTIQINEINYPLKVEPGQGFQITTSLTVTCNQATVPVTGRVDLYEQSTGRLLGISGFPVGYNPTQVPVSVSRTTVSKVAASEAIGIWRLRMVIWLSVGEGVPALVAGRLEKPLQVQVREATATSVTTPAYTDQSFSLYAEISSNASITNVAYDSAQRLLIFNAAGPDGTTGFSSILMSKSLIDGAPVALIENGDIAPIDFSVSSNQTHYLVSFAYPLSSRTVIVGGSNTIPEFSSTIAPILLSIVAAAVAVSSFRRRCRVV